MEQTLVNPVTKRKIKAGGKTHLDLISKGILPPTLSPFPPTLGKQTPPAPSPFPSSLGKQTPAPSLVEQLPPKTLPAPTPEVQTMLDLRLQKEFQEEEKLRQDACRQCQSLYLDRITNLQPFSYGELDLLRKINKTCNICVTLHGYQDARKGSKSRETMLFEKARESSAAKIRQIEHDIAYKGLKALSLAGPESQLKADAFFPTWKK